jgi:glycosyltransferase involved in cell wall biosynthesis
MTTNVLSIIHYPVFGGPHNRNAQTAPALINKDVTTYVLVPDEPGNAIERLQQSGINVIAIPLVRIRAKLNPLYHLKLLYYYWRDVKRIRNLILELEIDIVQINGLVNTQGAVAAHFENKKVVWQILDTFAPILLRHLIMLIVKVLADVVMCTGRIVAEEHPGTLGFGDRLVLFYPPVNLVRFNPNLTQRNSARQKLEIQTAKFVVGNVGNLNPQKGHRTFIRAAAKLKERLPHAQFVILGAFNENHRSYFDDLAREAADLGLTVGKELIILDPDSDVANLAPAFDVFWLTSDPRSEGIPTVVEEAMTLGIPIVATKVGSISEIIQERKTGFLVEAYDVDGLANRTIELYENADLRLSLGSASHEFAIRNFSIERCALSHMKAYQLALNS